ncbi:hypothetical protein, partial [Arthrobacter rhombi]|uniref:hypothetical protein n=1 Tax=Arthrobacter rhombi TaxID=71253 RepID=UPI003FD210C7
LVVTSAPLFTVDTSRSAVGVVKSPWATMTRELKSAKIDGKFNIDIVTSDALGDYLDKRVNTFASAVAAIAENAPERFVTHQNHGYKQKEN